MFNWLFTKKKKKSHQGHNFCSEEMSIMNSNEFIRKTPVSALDEIKYYQSLCNKWKIRLGLYHWDIKVEVVSGREINNNRSRVDFSVEDENAVIRIKTRTDYCGYFEMNPEVIIVHELLHIVLEKTVKIEVNVIWEQALTQIAKALVNLEKENAELLKKESELIEKLSKVNNIDISDDSN